MKDLIQSEIIKVHVGEELEMRNVGLKVKLLSFETELVGKNMKNLETDTYLNL